MQLSSTSSALGVSFQTTPSSMSAFWLFLFFPPNLCFSPFTVCLCCLLCFMWAVSYASKLVKPASEVPTALCLHRKPSVINLFRRLYNSMHFLLYLEPGHKAKTSQCERFVAQCDPMPLCTHTHMYVCVHKSTVSVCWLLCLCRTHFSPLTPQPSTHWITTWWMNGCTKKWTWSVFVYEADDGWHKALGQSVTSGQSPQGSRSKSEWGLGCNCWLSARIASPQLTYTAPASTHESTRRSLVIFLLLW